ncbi:MAG: DUF6614 family protein [Myxococcota bacterium]
MDLYHVWCNLRPGVSDVEFCASVESYLGALRSDGRIESFRIARRKLGLGPEALGEFHIQIEVRDLAQLDRAFGAVSARTQPLEGLHAAVNRSVRDLTFALYRDFPDAQRRRGEEAF